MSKFLEIEQALSQQTIFIHINTKRSGDLELPDYLMQSASVTLKLSHYFAKPITLTETKIEAELSFGSSFIKCIIPLETIFAMTTEDNATKLWLEDAPAELTLKDKPQSQDSETTSPKLQSKDGNKDTKPKGRPTLKRIK